MPDGENPDSVLVWSKMLFKFEISLVRWQIFIYSIYFVEDGTAVTQTMEMDDVFSNTVIPTKFAYSSLIITIGAILQSRTNPKHSVFNISSNSASHL